MVTNEIMVSQLRRGDLVLPDLSYRTMGALFRAHRELGNGLQEKYYQRAVAAALRSEGLDFAEQIPVRITFESTPIGRYVADFLVENKIVLEIKAVSKLSLRDYRQVDAYLRTLHKELGILANFRTPELTYKRILNPTYSE